ncbi:MAG TPA: tyrosine-protein phosphatase [Acidimicrobiia bacterium]|nr:tyrosine-protein phosphatase [Acidimicrobiia bacterium]
MTQAWSPPEGTLNFRDLGGLPTGDGRVTRPGRLFRSAALGDVTAGGAARLHEELGITFVVDLRGAEESVAMGRGLLDQLPICHLNIPLRDFQSLVDDDADELPGAGDASAEEAGSVLMPHYVENLESDRNLVIAVDFLSRALVHGPVVAHCAFGKDRTGVVVALLLRTAGVTEEAVIGDYMASSACMADCIEQARRTPRYAAFADLDVWRCDEQMIRFYLRAVEGRYGGAEKWALGKGITEETIERLRAALLD